MANPKIRSASLFLGGVKMGEIEGVDYEYNSNDEAQFGDPGYIGHSDGAATTSLNASGIVPLKGMRVKIARQMQAKADFDVTLALVDGDIHEVTMRAVQYKVTGSQKSGTLMGAFKWEGGEPKISG